MPGGDRDAGARPPGGPLTGPLPGLFFRILLLPVAVLFLSACAVLLLVPGSALRADLPWVVASVAILLLVSVALSQWLARQWIRPLQHLHAQIQATPAAPGGQPWAQGVPLPHGRSGMAGVDALHAELQAFVQRTQARINDLTLDGELFRSLLNGLRAGVVCLDREGRIRFMNEQVDRSLLDATAQSDRYFERMRHPVMLDYVSRVMKGQIDEGAGDRPSLSDAVWLDSGELEFLTGERCFRLRHRLVRSDETQVFYLLILEDVTEEHNTRRVREDFFQNASHELKTPITSIRGYAETLLPRIHDSVQHRFLEGIVRNAERMDRLVHDMVVVSSLESRAYPFAPESVDLRAFLAQMQLLVEGMLKQKRQELILETGEMSVRVMGDPLLLEHLFVNLIGNASRYSPEGGQIRIDLRPLDAARLEIRVTDQGPGIPEEYREKIFERFFRIDQDRSRKEGGTGLGLSIVRHVVRLHAGSIRVEASSEGGACFVVVLPVRQIR